MTAALESEKLINFFLEDMAKANAYRENHGSLKATSKATSDAPALNSETKPAEAPVKNKHLPGFHI